MYDINNNIIINIYCVLWNYTWYLLFWCLGPDINMIPLIAGWSPKLLISIGFK